MPLVEAELRRIAQRQCARRAATTFAGEPTALINEALFAAGGSVPGLNGKIVYPGAFLWHCCDADCVAS